jgi:hypothetical protein
MNGLISSTPSQAAIRLTVSGFLLMQIQSALLLMSPSLDHDSGTLIWILTPCRLGVHRRTHRYPGTARKCLEGAPWPLIRFAGFGAAPFCWRS